MITFNMVLDHLKEDSGCRRINQQANTKIRNIELLDSEGIMSAEDSLYILSVNSLKAVLDNTSADSHFMLIITDLSNDIPCWLESSTLSYIVSSCTTQEIGNRLINYTFRFNQWCDEIRRYIYQRKSIQRILDLIAEQVCLSMFWMNSGYRLVASKLNDACENTYIQELLLNGFLSHHSIDEIFGRSHKFHISDSEEISFYEETIDSGYYLLLCRIKKRHLFLKHFLIISENIDQQYLIKDYMTVFADLLQQYASMEKISARETEEGVTDLLSDLIEQKIESDTELADRISSTPGIMSEWYQCIVVGYEGIYIDREKSGLIYALRKIFDNLIVLLYDRYIILLIKKQNNSPLSFDRKQLELVLTQNQAYACIGNQTKYLTSFRALYKQTMNNLRLGMKLNRNLESRILVSEQYQIFQIIDICATLGEDIHDGNLIYLCSPRYVSLRIYDKNNNDNLCSIFESYVKNNCNTSHTAAELGLHRNTLINKLTKIEDIVGGCLDNASLRLDLIFSASIMEYADTYYHTDLMNPRTRKVIFKQ